MRRVLVTGAVVAVAALAVAVLWAEIVMGGLSVRIDRLDEASVPDDLVHWGRRLA